MTEHDDRVRREQLRLINQRSPVAMLLASLLLGYCLVVYTPIVGWSTLVAPLAILGIAIPARLALIVAWRRGEIDDRRCRRHLQLHATLIFFAAAGWTLLIMGLFWRFSGRPEFFTEMATLTAVAFGLAMVPYVAFAPHPPTFFAALVPCMAAAIGVIVLAPETSLRVAAFLFVAYLSGAGVLGYVQNRSFRDLIRLRYETEDLVEAYREQKEIAETSARAKSRFLAAASHDLRQPIHAIGLLAETLEAEARTPDVRIMSQSISESVDDLRSLLEVILDISKIDAGLIEPHRQAFPLKRLLVNVEKNFRSLALSRGLELRVRYTRHWVYSDMVLLERMVTNLVSNALRYTNQGGVLIGARRAADGGLRIEVWDTGVGIAAEALNEIFLEYYQVGNLARAPNEGLGLGLSIVRGLAQTLGHGIGVRSRPGRGSVFSIEVPLAAHYLEPWQDWAPLPASEGGARVLLIDDDARVRHATQRLLETCGYEVRSASDKAAAFEIVDGGFEPAVVFCDYRLQGSETGSEILNQIRARYGLGIRGVLLTADTAPERLIEATTSGYVLRHKPLSAQQLRRTLIDLLPVRDAVPAAAAGDTRSALT